MTCDSLKFVSQSAIQQISLATLNLVDRCYVRKVKETKSEPKKVVQRVILKVPGPKLVPVPVKPVPTQSPSTTQRTTPKPAPSTTQSPSTTVQTTPVPSTTQKATTLPTKPPTTTEQTTPKPAPTTTQKPTTVTHKPEKLVERDLAFKLDSSILDAFKDME